MVFSILVQVEKLQGEVGEKEKILKSLLGKFWIFVLLYVHVYVHERIILSVYGYGWLTKQVQNLLLHFWLPLACTRVILLLITYNVSTEQIEETRSLHKESENEVLRLKGIPVH